MKSLSKLLSKSVTCLRSRSGQSIYVLGTAHVSKRSCEQAVELISVVKPSAVLLELCEQRGSTILNQKNTEKQTTAKLIDAMMKGQVNTFSVMYSYVLENVAADLETKPGQEFIVANEAAKAVNAIKLRLLKFMFLSNHASSSSEDLRQTVDDMTENQDMVDEMLNQLESEFPWVSESLIRERDQYLTIYLHQACREIDGDIVAVVGAGHVAGIKRLWDENLTNEEEDVVMDCISQYPGQLGQPFTQADLRSYMSSRLEQRHMSISEMLKSFK